MNVYLVFKISVVNVVSDGSIFHIVLTNSVVNAQVILHVVSKISVISVVSDEIMFYVVLNIIVVSVVSDSP